MCVAWRRSAWPRGSITISLPPRSRELLEEGGGDGVVLDRVGADDDGAVGVLDLVEGGGDGARADVLHQRRDRGGVAEPGAVVDVVVAEALPDQALEEVRLLVGALGAAEARDPARRRAAFSPAAAASSASSQLASRKWVERVGGVDVHPLGGASSRRISGRVRRCGWWM